MMSLDEGISAFIARIYESASDREAWDGVARTLVELTHSHALFISTVDAEHRQYSSGSVYGPDTYSFDKGLEEFWAGLYKHDPSLAWAAANPYARFCNTRDLIPSADYLEHPWIKWSRSRLGSTHWLVGYTTTDDGLTFGVSVHAPAAIGPVASEDERLFRMLFDHMEHAVRLAARPPMIEGSKAVIILDPRGNVREASEAAQHILSCQDGLLLVDKRLECSRAADTSKLNAAIKSALSALSGGTGGAVKLSRPSGKRDWLVTVTPMPCPPSPCQAFGGGAVVKIIDPVQHTRLSSLHADLFGFTKRESEIANLLLAGHSVETMAVALNIKPTTAKDHLHSLFRKTDTRRQSDLVGLLAALN